MTPWDHAFLVTSSGISWPKYNAFDDKKCNARKHLKNWEITTMNSHPISSHGFESVQFALAKVQVKSLGFWLNWLINQSWNDFVLYKIFGFIVFLIFEFFIIHVLWKNSYSFIAWAEKKWLNKVNLITKAKVFFNRFVLCLIKEKRFHRYTENCRLFHHLPVLGGWAQVCHKFSTGRNGSRVTAALRHLRFPHLNVMLLRTINLWYKPYRIIHD